MDCFISIPAGIAGHIYGYQRTNYYSRQIWTVPDACRVASVGGYVPAYVTYSEFVRGAQDEGLK